LELKIYPTMGPLPGLAVQAAAREHGLLGANKA